MLVLSRRAGESIVFLVDGVNLGSIRIDRIGSGYAEVTTTAEPGVVHCSGLEAGDECYIIIGDTDVTIYIRSIRGNQVKLAIDAPKHINIVRSELLNKELDQ